MDMTPNTFREIAPEAITDNVFKLIGKDQMLITAGTMQAYNTMTASWGGFGVMWNKKICFCVIRPHRYTYTFIERSDYFTLSFFAEQHKEILEFCGKHSGKDTNKIEETGITPAFGPSGAVYFNEARLVLECRKVYFSDMNPDHFLDASIHQLYPNKDYHRMYVGEIIRVLAR